MIEQAKGMLAERFEIDVDEAFERLRHQARSHRIKMHVLAAHGTRGLGGSDRPAGRAEKTP